MEYPYLIFLSHCINFSIFNSLHHFLSIYSSHYYFPFQSISPLSLSFSLSLFLSLLHILTLYICAQITLTKVGRALIVEERRLQLSCHARSVLIRIRLARATFPGVPVALCVATLEQARHIGDCHIAIGTDATDSSSTTVATVGFLVACSL